MTAFLLSIPCLFAATVAEVSNWPDEAYQKRWACSLSGVVAEKTPTKLIIEDSTGRVKIFCPLAAQNINAGDLVNFKCIATIDSARRNALIPRNLVKTGNAPRKPPEETTIARIVRGEHDLKSVRVRGMVVGAAPDEIEPGNAFLQLSDGMDVVDAAIDKSLHPERLIGAEIEVTGLCDPEIGCWRQFQGCGIERIPGVEYVKVLTPPPDDPFSAPPLFAIANITTRNLAALGRRSATGRVIAVWHGDSMILSAANHGRWNTFQATLADGQRLPRCGDVVQVVGLPRTDLFTITLDNALCRQSQSTKSIPQPSKENPREVTAKALLLDDAGLDQVQAMYHGRIVRIRGKVRSVPADDLKENHVQLQSGDHIVPLDISSCPEVAADIAPECEIEVVGVCLLLADLWKPNSRMPRVRGMAVIVRDAADVKVLSRPSWWTPGRLLTVISALLLAVLAIVVWNWSLRRLVARRSRQLLDSQIKKAESDMRFKERTRLAAELHDAISQMLTGVSLQIDSAADTIRTDLPAAERFLAIARQTLLSCREELHRCLWDLRNNLLDGADFSESLRKAILPCVGLADLTVRFNVSHGNFRDTVIHAILCIVRELCANAVRHGGAQHVIVEGVSESDSIKFSVTDDGCGFDPAKCPGPADGHFGLQGIRERVTHFGGSLSIRSKRGSGTSINIEMKSESR